MAAAVMGSEGDGKSVGSLMGASPGKAGGSAGPPLRPGGNQRGSFARPHEPRQRARCPRSRPSLPRPPGPSQAEGRAARGPPRARTGRPRTKQGPCRAPSGAVLGKTSQLPRAHGHVRDRNWTCGKIPSDHSLREGCSGPALGHVAAALLAPLPRAPHPVPAHCGAVSPPCRREGARCERSFSRVTDEEAPQG